MGIATQLFSYENEFRRWCRMEWLIAISTEKNVGYMIEQIWLNQKFNRYDKD